MTAPVAPGAVRLTGRGAGALALGLVVAGAGLWWRYPGLAGLGLALAGLVLAGWVSVLMPAPVTPRRTVSPREVPRLGSCTGTLRLTSASRRLPVLLDATDLVAGTPVRVDVPVLGPAEQVSVEYPIPTPRRGVLRIGPLTLRRRGLAGLAEARTVLGDVTDVRVVPRVLPVRGLPAGVRRSQVGADERVERGGTDLVGLREYVPGDDLRRLHWATSARTGVLMVREDADPARPHLAVLIADDAAGYPDPHGFEDAVEVAASLLAAALAQGHPVHVLSSSGAVDLEAAGAEDAALLRTALAEVALAGAGSGGAPVPARDLDVLAVVCGPETDLAPLLLQAGRASVGVVCVVDPQPAAMVTVFGAVLVLRAPRAEELLAAWDTAVLR